MSGPQQQRLANSLNGADPGQVLAAADEWARAGELLAIVAQQLQAHQSTPQSAIGGQTGAAVSGAFGRSATAMTNKAEELGRGSGALRNAGAAIQSAETTHQGLGPQEAPPHQPNFGPGPRTPAEDRALIDSQNQQSAYQAEYDRREREARQAADQMDSVFADSSATLREIHGAKRTEPGGPAGGGSSSTGGTGSGGGGGVTTGGGGGGAHPGGKPTHGGGGHVGAVLVTPGHPTPDHGGTHETVPTAVPTTTTSPLGTTFGSSQGADAVSPASLVGGGATAGCSPTSSSATVSSTGTGAAIGGLAVGSGGSLRGSGSNGAAVRGVAHVAGAGNNARTIGASGARGGAATLGRPGIVAGSTPASATGNRSGSASSARATGAGARSGSGASGRAGSRQAMGTGGGAGGGGKGNGRRKKGGSTTPSQYAEEWELDDEETGPQLID